MLFTSCLNPFKEAFIIFYLIDHNHTLFFTFLLSENYFPRNENQFRKKPADNPYVIGVVISDKNSLIVIISGYGSISA